MMENKIILLQAEISNQSIAKLTNEKTFHECDPTYSKKESQSFSIEVSTHPNLQDGSLPLGSEYLQLLSRKKKDKLTFSMTHNEGFEESQDRNKLEKFRDEVTRALFELSLLSTLTSTLAAGKNYGIIDVFHADRSDTRPLIDLSQGLSLVTALYVQAERKLTSKLTSLSRRIANHRAQYQALFEQIYSSKKKRQWELLHIDATSSSDVRGRRFESSRDSPAIDCSYISLSLLETVSLYIPAASLRSVLPVTYYQSESASVSLKASSCERVHSTLRFTLLTNVSEILQSKSLWNFVQGDVDAGRQRDAMEDEIVRSRHESLCQCLFQFFSSEATSFSFPVVAQPLYGKNSNKDIIWSSDFSRAEFFKTAVVSCVERGEITFQFSPSLFFKVDLIPLDLEEVEERMETKDPLVATIIEKCVVYSLVRFFSKIGIFSSSHSPPFRCLGENLREKLLKLHPLILLARRDSFAQLNYFIGLLHLFRAECLRKRVYVALMWCKSHFGLRVNAEIISPQTNKKIYGELIDNNSRFGLLPFFELTISSKNLRLQSFYSSESFLQIRKLSSDSLDIYLNHSLQENLEILENENQLKEMMSKLMQSEIDDNH